MNDPVPSAVLSGDLAMLRSFENTGVPTCVIGSDPQDLKFYSRYSHPQKIIAPYASQPDKALCDLIELGKSFSTKPVLFYDDDQFTLFISKHRNQLEKYYHFLLPPHALLENLIQKSQFASLAEQYKFPIPKTVSSEEIETVEALLERVTLPCFFKPKNGDHWKTFEMITERNGKYYKGFRANDIATAHDLYDQFRKFNRDFIVQDYILGDDTNIYSFHGYFDRQSNPLAFFVGRKIRTFPRECGLSTYLELTQNQEVAQLGTDILRQINYVGLAKIDFKKDVRTNKFYILEINPRATLWNHLGAANGMNLSLVAYYDLIGEKVDPPKEYQTNVRWISFGADLKGFLLDYRKEADLHLIDWLLSFWSQKVYFAFSWKDPAPFLVSVGSYIKALLKRLVKKRGQ